MNNYLQLKQRLLQRIVVEFDPMRGVHYTVDIRSDGTVLFSTPSNPQGEVTVYPPSASEIIREQVRALFMREHDTEGTPSENAYHWKADFYSRKGVLRTMEGYRGEPQERFAAFAQFLSALEAVTVEDLGSFFAQKKCVNNLRRREWTEYCRRQGFSRTPKPVPPATYCIASLRSS